MDTKVKPGFNSQKDYMIYFEGSVKISCACILSNSQLTQVLVATINNPSGA